MPRYFFHVHDGSDFPDLQGTELDDLASARTEAVRFAGSLLSDGAETFWGKADWKMEVMDESGMTLFQLIFAGIDAPSTLGR